jgi:WD40 repeat protein
MVSLTGHSDPVNHLAFAPDNLLLASGGDDGCVWLWNIPARTPLARLSWGAKFVFALAFSPDGQTLAVGTDSSVLLLREEGGTWKPFHQAREHQSWVTSVSFTRDGQLLATGSADGTIRLWDAATRRKKSLKTFTAGLGAVRSVEFAPNGLAIAAGGASGVGLWTATDYEPIVFYKLPDSDVRSIGFSPNGQSLLAAAGRAVLYADLTTPQPTPVLSGGPGAFRCLAIAKNDARLLTGREDGGVQLWEKLDGPPRDFACHTGAVNGLAFSPDGKTAASAGDDFCVCIWDV